jgi:hypothetical protein
VYIGQTGRSLKQRITEHRRAIRNGDLATSALAEHAWNTGHHFDTATAEIIDAHPHVTTRCLLESWHIQKDDNTINREKGTLPREYTSLLGSSMLSLHNHHISPPFCIKALSFHPVIFPDEGNCVAETLELIFFQILASVDDLGLTDGYT